MEENNEISRLSENNDLDEQPREEGPTAATSSQTSNEATVNALAELSSGQFDRSTEFDREVVIDHVDDILSTSPTADQTHEERPSSSISPSVNAVAEKPTEIPSFTVTGYAIKQELAHWFPQIDADDKKSWRIWISKRSRALLIHTGLVGAILLINFALTLWGVTHYAHPHGVATIYQGSCAVVKRLDLWLHLLINLLGTGMLMASNYCMQLQAAPTRKNVDKAHNAEDWLDIGVPSLRNLRYISNWRRFSWLLLALSSLPVHLV